MMNLRFRPTGPVLFTLLVAAASPLHGQVPGGLAADDLTGIREAHLAASWSEGLADESPVELDSEQTRDALRLPREASAKVKTILGNAYLKPRNTGAGDFFATVAVSGDTVVVGAPFEDSSATKVNGNAANNSARNSGAAYVFVRNSGQWVQQAYLKASDGAAGDQFGFSVAISGETVVVGAYAAGDITTTPAVPATATTPAKPAITTQTQYLGAAYVFIRTGTKWTEQKILTPTIKPDAGDSFGYSVAVSANTAVVGAVGEAGGIGGVGGDGKDNTQAKAGAAYVFFRSGTTWTQQAYLKASKPEINDLFGIAVAVSGDTVVVGAPNESGNGKGKDGGQSNNLAKSSGAAYVFTRATTTWRAQAYLKANHPDAGDLFGRAVGISGERIIIGAPGEASSANLVNGNPQNNSAAQAGAAYVFGRIQYKIWQQQAYLKASKSSAGDSFGFAVAISGDTAVVGAMNEDGGGKNAGAAHLYTRDKSGWSWQSVLRARNRGAGDKLGFSVAVSGETVVCGALSEAGDTKTVNGPSNNRAKDAGAAYVFEDVGPQAPAIAVEQPVGSVLISGKATVSFGATVATLPVAKTFTIVNNGKTPLTGIRVSVTGANPADFTLDTTAMATTVAAAGTTTFIVTFATSSTEPRTATVVVLSDDKNQSRFSIALQGNGVGVSKIGLNLEDGTALTDGGALDFGQVRLGSKGVTKTFTVLNTGNGILKNLVVSASGLNRSDFSVTPLRVTELEPGQTTSFRVTLKPSATQKRLGTITIASNSLVAGLFEIYVSGTGVTTGKKTLAPSLAEIARGSRASAATAQPASSVTVLRGAKFLTLTLTKPSDGRPVGVVQVSPNLLDWYSGSQHTTVITDDATTLKIRDNTPVTPDAKRYIRLK